MQPGEGLRNPPLLPSADDGPNRRKHAPVTARHHRRQMLRDSQGEQGVDDGLHRRVAERRGVVVVAGEAVDLNIKQPRRHVPRFATEGRRLARLGVGDSSDMISLNADVDKSVVTRALAANNHTASPSCTDRPAQANLARHSRVPVPAARTAAEPPGCAPSSAPGRPGWTGPAGRRVPHTPGRMR